MTISNRLLSDNRFGHQLCGSLPLLVSILGLWVAGCGGTPKTTTGPVVGSSDFTSRPPSSQGNSKGYDLAAPSAGAVANTSNSNSSTTSTPRTVEETDLYRLDGDRLYYLNAYRGLMVFDITNVDAPKLLGRSPIYGSPIEMLVRNGVATVVVSDWYGTDSNGTPFYGSIVRGIDATDPAHMKVLGDAVLGGWVRDTRVVGDVLYAVTEQYSWDPMWYGGSVAVSNGSASSTTSGVAVSSSSGASVAVTSVNFANGNVQQADRYQVPGQGGVFNVTSSSIMLASSETTTDPQYGYQTPTGRTQLMYLDISDPAGDIKERGSLMVDGTVQGWGADNGRWNIDFADGKTAHAIACAGQYCSTNSNLVLSTVDFSNPDAPIKQSALTISSTSYSPTARFDGTRMYLSPADSSCYYNGSTSNQSIPVQIYDLSEPTAPRFAGSADITGQVWLFMPNGSRLFALGNLCNTKGNYYGSSVSLSYLDVTNANMPSLIGTASFGQGWAWTPAASTFKAFTKNDAQGLVVLPFSGWDSTTYEYNNGLQLIEYTPSSINTAGAAKSRGWVERGIFAKNRLVSLSDLALTVVDFTDHANPKVVTETTLARNVVDVKPRGDTVAELSSDFWDNDQKHSALRILPTAQAEENVSDATLAEVEIDGYNSSVFHNGDFSYVVSNIQQEVDCSTSGSSAPSSGTTSTCYNWTQEIQVVDRSNGTAVKRGKIDMPSVGGYWYGGWGWYGCDMYSWYYGADVVQVGHDALVFKRWLPQYAADGTYLDASTALYVVDLANPDQPKLASTTITDDLTAWWGNMRAVGDKLYTGHYEWELQPKYDGQTYDPGIVRYYLDQIDLGDRAHPRIAAKINVPGILVGADENDPSVVYTMDYQWASNQVTNRFDVLRLSGDKAYLQGWFDIPGWVGNTFVQGSTAYFSAETYDSDSGSSSMSLYQINVSDPQHPTVLPSKPTKGWGWLLGVQGDRAFVTSGWGNVGIDVFRLQPGQAPVFDQFIRVRGWWTNSLARQDNQLFLASGYWGTQVVNL